ncbi:MAG: DEAD/DEAH box helicase [Prevotella sp.]|jgi:superfamily II DNA/RNA helicase|nr:DEAD/DEAH box helicase [Prevotella sp.]MCH4182723.1 DEAD/DEAH box helicase [Prevotella sp.]MCH4213135.1 DEAD/DEAH box helicase [Prevotella sp.]MCH4242521.1 DEAD/DEAH box helicase [Prevotella sp.]
MKFEELNLNDHVLDALYDMHFDACTPIQEKCIPEILKGKDVLGVAQTGTGKTAAYLLPILSKLDDGGYPDKAINCLIMSPTRELAQQIDQAMQGFGYYLNGVSSVAIYGGNDGNRYDQEVKSLRMGADVIIATPGRLISHISLGNVDLSKVSFFVLDEADRMLDMGFSEDIEKISKYLPKNSQTIMFSATMPDKIESLAKTLLKDPVEVKLAVSKPAEKIKQSAYICYETQKMEIIKDIFKTDDLKRVLVFCGSKIKVKQVAGALQRKHVNCGEMHSDLDQAERDDMMFKFKSGQYDVLVATDILARGIDIDDIAMVINYDVPHDAEDYVHRIGRTARAEREGIAVTLVNEDDMYYFSQIEKFLGKEITKNSLPGELKGPEYKVTGYPPRRTKSTAKDHRRKDRDETSHRNQKHAPRREGSSYNRRNEQGAKEPIQREKKNYRKPNPQGEDGQNASKQHSRNPQYNSQRRPERTDDFKRKTRPSSTDDPERKSYRQKPYRNNNGSNKEQHNYHTNPHQNRPQPRPVTPKPQEKAGGIKKFFKKLFGKK